MQEQNECRDWAACDHQRKHLQPSRQVTSPKPTSTGLVKAAPQFPKLDIHHSRAWPRLLQ